MQADPLNPFHKGRGARSNPSGRFEAFRREAVDDGWQGDGDAPPLRTTVEADSARSVITRNGSPDLPFDRSINPYRGCEHGCTYCYARSSHAWLGLSPGLDFETRLFAKLDAPKLLEAELRHPTYSPAMVALGTNTDPYQPIEKRLRLTRGILETLEAYRHPVGIVTKSALVVRDIDVLKALAARNLVRVQISIGSLDREVARRIEPRAATPARRLDAIATLSAAGIPVGVLAAPVIPGLTDHEIEAVLKAARHAGASMAAYTLLRLPMEVKDLFWDSLRDAFPNRLSRAMRLVRESRGGRQNDTRFHRRMIGEGVYAALIKSRFAAAHDRLGFDKDPPPLDMTAFRRPPAEGDQLTLF